MSGPVVSDKMRYGLKPLAVTSKHHLITLNCLGTNVYKGETGSTIRFRLQHNPTGRYIDPAATKIKFTFTLTLPESIANCPADSFYFERGPESIIRRFTVMDLQNRVIEDIDQYNLLYAMTELCTADPSVRERRGCFNMEGWPGRADLGGWIKHPQFGFQNGLVTNVGFDRKNITFDITFTPLSGVFGGACEKYIPMSALEGMEIHMQLEDIRNCIKYKFTPNVRHPDITAYNLALQPELSDNQFPNAFADLRDNVAEADVAAFIATQSAQAEWDDVLLTPVLKTANQSLVSYSISDPKILIDCLDVEPSINMELINAAKDPRDGMIRIQTFSWTSYATQIPSGLVGVNSWTIPVSLGSIKSVFFTLRNVGSKSNDMNCLKSGFEHRALLKYRILLGGQALSADWITVSDLNKFNTYSEAVGALMEAWSVHHKTDGHPGLITRESYAPRLVDMNRGKRYREINAVFGHELESFSGKSGVIQSGISTMNTTFVLETEYGPRVQEILPRPFEYQVVGGQQELETADDIELNYPLYEPDDAYELRCFFMFDKAVAFDEKTGNIYAEY